MAYAHLTLIDTSIWIDHFRRADARLDRLVANEQVLGHPHVTGELACGKLPRRQEFVGLMSDLPQAHIADDNEVLELIERHRLMGSGIGYLDAHLLASTFMTAGACLWTRDRRLAKVSLDLKIAAPQTRFTS